jgi:putative endonuclease
MKRVRPGTVGLAIEIRAIDFLRGQGLTLIERNFRCRHGEVDAVMRDGDTLVFVEVRYRRDDRQGLTRASVDDFKQRRIVLASADFLQRHFADREPACRFDVVIATGNASAPHFDWISNAFQA